VSAHAEIFATFSAALQITREVWAVISHTVPQFGLRAVRKLSPNEISQIFCTLYPAEDVQRAIPTELFDGNGD
jgi:hypothetical protein